MIFRAFITKLVKALDGRTLSEDTLGVFGESFDAEVFEQYGFSVNPEDGGEALGFDINNDPNHRVMLPPRGDEHGQADVGTVKIYYGPDTNIVLSDDKIIITRGDFNATIEGDTLTTNLNVHTTANATIEGDVTVNGKLAVTGDITAKSDVKATGDVKAGTISLKTHKHLGVSSGNASTAVPTP